jgi:regulatory protein YycI of two-component signal transduction system YycFG
MDWGRAKTILILSFLFLNMILGLQLWESKSKQKELTTDTSGVLEELKQVLQSKNIRLAEELPKEVPKLREITVKFDESIKASEKTQLRTPTTRASVLGKTLGKDSTARSEIPRMDSYRLDAVASRDGVIIFNQLFSQLPMFEVKLELFEQGGEITSYRQAFVEVESGGDQKEQTVIPAHKAIRSLVEKYLLEGSVITDVQLGYHGQLYNSQTQFMIPTWRVAIDNGDIFYVQAFNGAVDEPQKDAIGAANGTSASKTP